MTKSRSVLCPEEETSRWSHGEKQKFVCLTDVLHVLQLCFLCFTLLKAMLLYHIFTSVSWVSLTVTIQNLPSSSPLIHFFHWPSSSPYISRSFYLSPHVLSLCPSLLRSVSRGPQVQEVFLSAEPSRSSWSQTKHRKKMCLWCACTCMAAPLFGSIAPSSPLLLMTLKGV